MMPILDGLSVIPSIYYNNFFFQKSRRTSTFKRKASSIGTATYRKRQRYKAYGAQNAIGGQKLQTRLIKRTEEDERSPD